MNQSETIAKSGLMEAAVPIGPYKTYQVPIAEVERLTLLEFTGAASKTRSLSEFDPMRSGVEAAWKRRKRMRGGMLESAVERGATPEGYLPLDDLDSMFLG